MIALLTSLLMSTGPAHALSMDLGRCLPLDPTNPAYQVLCARFDQSPNGCETQRHICYWKSSSPLLQINADPNQESSLIAKGLTNK